MGKKPIFLLSLASGRRQGGLAGGSVGLGIGRRDSRIDLQREQSVSAKFLFTYLAVPAVLPLLSPYLRVLNVSLAVGTWRSWLGTLASCQAVEV